MTDPEGIRHTHSMALVSAGAVAGSRVDSRPTPPGEKLSFEQVYDEHVDFVWRMVRRLGVPDVEDAVQDVFVVAHRRLGDFEGRSTMRTWLYGIALRVAREHRRRARPGETIPDALPSEGRGPEGESERQEALRILDAILGCMDEVKREAFLLAELGEMTAPEIAEATGAPLNTVYSRIRAARQEFEDAVARQRARDGRRTR